MVVPTPDGERNPLVLAAAHCAAWTAYSRSAARRRSRALAYGTRPIPRSTRSSGPGNAYVAAAKRRVFGVVGIDMVAGPSEILVIADGNANPDWVAMDLFSQAEHDELAQAILLSPGRALHRPRSREHRAPAADDAASRRSSRHRSPAAAR